MDDDDDLDDNAVNDDGRNSTEELKLDPSELQLTSITYENIEQEETEPQKKNAYYEAVNFQSASQKPDKEAEDDSDYEEVIVNNSILSFQDHGSLPAEDGKEYETMFALARRFPSIRMESSKKKEQKRRSQTSSTLSFGQSLDQLYSKPDRKKKSNTIVPVVAAEKSAVRDVSGSSVRPVEAIYAVKSSSGRGSVSLISSSLASLRKSISDSFSASVISLRGSFDGGAERKDKCCFCCVAREKQDQDRNVIEEPEERKRAEDILRFAHVLITVAIG